MKIFQLVTICLLAYAASPASAQCTNEQPICEVGANGSDVVNAVLATIEQANIFNDSDTNRFLRRVAYVTTRDGTIYRDEDEMSAHGGIWTFDEGKLNLMRQALFLGSLGIKLKEVNNLIEFHFGIDILEHYFSKQYVNTPLYCGIAIRFYLYYLELVECMCIPPALDLRGQANLWLTHFNVTVGSRPCLEDLFVDEVKQLEKQEGI